MENVKRKRREVINKNNGFKPRSKTQKRTKKKAKRKQNFNSSITGHKCCKLTAHGALKGPRMKDRRGVDGMFFKGLRTQYVTREGLNEANAARKNEDINKIIDIGRVFFEKGEVPVPRGRAGKRVVGAEKPGKTVTERSSSDSLQDSDCSLSPISATDSDPTQVSMPKDRRGDRVPEPKKKLSLEKELRSFALKYEATVAGQILQKLPSSGVLEDALAALKKLREKKQNTAVVSPDLRPGFEFEREESLYSEEFEFLRDGFCSDLPPTDDFILARSFLAPGKHFGENLMENSTGNMFIMNAGEVENPNHPSHLTVYDNDDENKSSSVIKFQAKDFQKPVKELSIATPPIQFYPRNMF